MTIDYIKKTYGVPAKRGRRITYKGSAKGKFGGVILGSTHGYLSVRLDGSRKSILLHPTWNIEYLDDNQRVIWPQQEKGNAQ